MSQRLFSTGKIGLFLDGYRPATEKRKSGETTVVKLALRVAPFDAKLANAVDDGLGEDSNVRASLFNMNHPDPKPHLERVNFALGCPRQNIELFASPDTKESRLALLQVKISGAYARTQKDQNGYQFCFTGTLGPVGTTELEFIHAWYLSQKFATFQASEPDLELEVDSDDEDDDGEADAPPPVAPMWDDDPPRAAAADAPARRKKPGTQRSHRKLHSHQSKKKGSRKR